MSPASYLTAPPRVAAAIIAAASITRMRVGVVDLGTNSTRLLVADVHDGRIDEVVRRLRITRLGEGVDARRRLLPLPIARVRNVLADFRRGANAGGRDERRPRRRERRVVPGPARVELRLLDAPALRRRGGAPHLPRR